MTRRCVTRPELRVGGYWLSSIVPTDSGWGELEHSTRDTGTDLISWEIPNVTDWRHPALLATRPIVELCLGPTVIASATLETAGWDSGQFVALGACRAAERAMALDADGNASTSPNEVIDAAILRGVLPWRRVGDFGDDPMGDATTTGVVTIRSILDAWAQRTNQRWYVDARRNLVILPAGPSSPKWLIVPGAGVMGTSTDDRADRVFARYLDSGSGDRATASHPAATPAGGIERPADLISGRGALSSTDAADEAEAIWQRLQGKSGWTNGLTLTHGQVTTHGGVVADLAAIKAGDTMRLLGVRDPRGLSHNLDVVIGDTDYSWGDDEIQVNPVGLSASDTEAALEQISNVAVDAMTAATTQPIG